MVDFGNLLGVIQSVPSAIGAILGSDRVDRAARALTPPVARDPLYFTQRLQSRSRPQTTKLPGDVQSRTQALIDAMGGTRGGQPSTRLNRLPSSATSLATPALDPTQQLFQQLIDQLQAPVAPVAAPDISQFYETAQAQIDPVYDARIQAIRNLMSQAEQRTATGRQDVEQLYEALSQDYQGMLPEVEAQAQEAEQQTEELYGQLASNLEGTYQRIAGEQADLFERLGIEAAAPEAIGPQSRDLAQALTRAQETSTAAQQRQREMGDIDVSYYRQGAPLAGLEGAGRSADLLQDLQDYLQTQETGIGTLEAQRSSDLARAYQDLAMQAAQQQAQAQQSQREEERYRQEQLFNILQQQMQQQQQAIPEMPKLPSEIADMQNYLAYLSPPVAEGALDALAALEQTEEWKIGRQQDPTLVAGQPGFRIPITLETRLAMARQMAEEAGLSEQETQALLDLIRINY